MHHPSVRRVPALWRDRILAVTAYTGYAAIGIFALTQAQPNLAIAPDLRFQLTLWLIMLGGTAAICRRMQPGVAGLIGAMRLGRDAAQARSRIPTPARNRRCCSYGRIGAACYGVVVATEACADRGLIALHGIDQYMVILVFSSFGAVGTIVRISVPFVERATDVFMAAYLNTAGDPEDTGPIPKIPSEVGL